MGRSKLLLYVALGLLFIVYVLIEMYKPKPLDWTVTYLSSDKNPFGTYILLDRLDDLFPKHRVSFETLFESKDQTENLLILTETFEPGDTDLKVLFAELDSGQQVFIASEYFSQDFMDTLQLDSDTRLRSPLVKADTVTIDMGDREAHLSDAIVRSFFVLNEGTGWDTLGLDWEGQPVLIEKAFGLGKLVLCSTPLAFTNFGMMQDRVLAEAALNSLSYTPVHYTHFYHYGKIQNTSPLRYVLSEVPLRWAVYLTVFTLLWVLLINSQRRQRVIPVHAPPVNSTTEFIKTLASVFYRRKDHGQAALKIGTYHLSELRQRFLRKPEFNEQYYNYISAKLGVEKRVVIRIMEQIRELKNGAALTQPQLKSFYNDLNHFK